MIWPFSKSASDRFTELLSSTRLFRQSFQRHSLTVERGGDGYPQAVIDYLSNEYEYFATGELKRFDFMQSPNASQIAFEQSERQRIEIQDKVETL